MDVKSIFASKTIWGAILMFAPTVLGFFGFTATEATGAINEVQAFVTHAVSFVGFVLTIWGRFTAKKALTLTGS